MINIELVSKYLVYLRQSKNWKQEHLANQLQISRQAVSRWETGMSLPNIDMLLKLSKLYNTTINDLLEPNISGSVLNIEQIMNVEKKLLKTAFFSFDKTDIVKASMGVSPMTSKLLNEIFEDINFDEERLKIGSVRIEEIEEIHAQFVSMINIIKNGYE